MRLPTEGVDLLFISPVPGYDIRPAAYGEELPFIPLVRGMV